MRPMARCAPISWSRTPPAISAYAIPPSAITGQYQVDLYGDNQAELAGIAFTNGPQVSTDKGDYRDNETVRHQRGGLPP